jgi:meso-butanediol dehydrogenase/(S,S)-butanediol dehydrogenase/diacetyl reductase
MRFDHKVAIVTGSSAGIGAATATRLLAEGASVILNGRDSDKLARFASTLPSDRILLHPDNVAHPEGAKRLVEAAIAQFGRIDILVNNASSIVMKDVASHTIDDWRGTFSSNVDAAFHMCQEALSHLGTNAAIVNVSSVCALGGDGMMVAYNAAKAALSNLTRALAVELGPRSIRVNAVLPSVVWTDRTAPLRDAPEIVSRQVERFPLGRIAEAAEIAAAIAFLASEDASYITGVNLPVDGGLTATSGLAPFA